MIQESAPEPATMPWLPVPGLFNGLTPAAIDAHHLHEPADTRLEGHDEIQVAGVRDLNDEELRDLLWSGPARRWPVLVSAILLGMLAFGAHLVGTGLGMSEPQQTDGGSRSWTGEVAREGPDTAWMPAGFRDVTGDGTAAYRSIAPIDPSCTAQTTSCIGYQVVTRDGCPNGFWMRVNVLNRMGVKMNEGWAVGPPVRPGEQAEVTVAWDGPPGSRYDIYDFQCRWSQPG